MKNFVSLVSKSKATQILSVVFRLMIHLEGTVQAVVRVNIF